MTRLNRKTPVSTSKIKHSTHGGIPFIPLWHIMVTQAIKVTLVFYPIFRTLRKQGDVLFVSFVSDLIDPALRARLTDMPSPPQSWGTD